MNRIRSPKYLEWVRSLDCEMTGAPADDPHHACGLGFGGMGTKPSDYLAVPLTRGAHTEIHQNPDLWPSQWEMIIRTLDRAFKEGVVVFSEDYQ